MIEIEDRPFNGGNQDNLNLYLNLTANFDKWAVIQTGKNTQKPIFRNSVPNLSIYHPFFE